MVEAFSLVAEAEPCYCSSIKLYKWISRRTGMQIVLVQRDSPVIRGNVVVATEANDDSGCPFAIEKLVSMGSKQYPYSGLLDKLSSKWYSEVDAFTGQDHTTYRLEALGLDAFENVLSLYLDCIFNPNISETTFLTEVYNIDANGTEGGAVFNEMQPEELFAENLIASEVKHRLYPEGSGYFSQTDGKPSAIRNLTWEKIRDYHAEKYQPSNVSLVIVGNLEPQYLLELISAYECRLPNMSSCPRPFVDSPNTNKPSPLTKTVTRKVLVPDFGNGSIDVTLAWIGPHIRDRINCTAFEIFFRYLEEGKLNARFVDTPNGKVLASNASTEVKKYLETRAEVSLFNVPPDELEKVGSYLLKFLETVVMIELDMSLIHQCIDDTFDELCISDDSWEQIVEIAISEFLYGDVDKGETFSRWLGSGPQLDELRSWSRKDWQEFIEKWVVEPAKVCVLAESSTEATSNIDHEARLISAKIHDTVDLNAAGETLRSAMSVKNKAIPEEVFKTFRTPDPQRITLISSKSAATPELMASIPENSITIDIETQRRVFGDASVGLAMGFESVKTPIVTVELFLTSESVDRKLLPLIDIILPQMFDMPMSLEDGRKLYREETLQSVNRGLLHKSVGRDAEMQEVIVVKIATRTENYAKAIKWLECVMLQNTVNDAQIALLLNQQLEKAALLRQSLGEIQTAAISDVLLKDESLQKRSDSILNESQIREFAANITQTVSDVKLMGNQLFRKENMRILIIADVQKLQDPLLPWKELESKLPGSFRDLSKPLGSSPFTSNAGELLLNRCFFTPWDNSLTGQNITVLAPGPANHAHEDLAVLAVTEIYFSMMDQTWSQESEVTNIHHSKVTRDRIIYKTKRFTSGYFVKSLVQWGKTVLSVSHDSDVAQMFRMCHKAMHDFVNIGKVDEEILSECISIVMKELVFRLDSPQFAAEQKFSDTVFKNLGPNHVLEVINKLCHIVPSDIVIMVDRYYLPLFDPRSSVMFAGAPYRDKSSLTNALLKLGYDLE